MKKVLIASLIFLSSCSKDNETSPAKSLGKFSVTVTSRESETAFLNWTTSANDNNSDAVKYRIYLSERVVADDISSNSWLISGLNGNQTYYGKVLAYTASGDTASSFYRIDPY